MRKNGPSFAELAKLAQACRKPCGKQAFGMDGARTAARERNAFDGERTWYPVVCFEGCGRNIFHPTTKRPGGRARAMFADRPKGRTQAERARRRRSARIRRRLARMRPEICVWEGEGGSCGG